MIQDIAPSKLNNSYSARRMQEGDLLLHFDPEGRVLVREKEGKISFLKAEAADCGGENVYLRDRSPQTILATISSPSMRLIFIFPRTPHSGRRRASATGLSGS